MIKLKIVNVFSDSSGGVKRYVETLNKCLLDYSNDVTVHNYIVSVADETVSMEYGDKNVLHIYSRKQNVIAVDQNILSDCVILDVLENFDKFLEIEKPDIVNFHHLDGVGASLISNAKERGISTIFTVHDYWCICPRLFLLNRNYDLCSGPDYGLKCASCMEVGFDPINVTTYMMRYDYVKKVLVEKTDKIIAVSDSVKKRLVEEGFPPDNIIVIYPYVDVDEHKNERINTDRQEKEPSHLKVGYIGAINPYKGVHVLIDAVKKLKNENRSNIETHLYGGVDPLFKETFQNLIEDASIHVHGPYRKEELLHIFDEIDVLVVPSIVPETGPLVVQEGLRHGIPVIGSNIGGLTNYIKPDYGYLFSTGDSVELYKVLSRISENRSILREWANNIPKLKCSQTYAKQLLTVFEQLLIKNNYTEGELNWEINRSHKQLLSKSDQFLTKKKDLLFHLKSIIKYLEFKRINSIVVFGAGLYGKKVTDFLMSNNFDIKFILDNDPKKWNTYYRNIFIGDPEIILQKNEIQAIIIVSEWEKEIESQLLKMKIPQEILKIYSFEYTNKYVD